MCSRLGEHEKAAALMPGSVSISKIKCAIAHHEALDVTCRRRHKTAGVVWIPREADIAGEREGPFVLFPDRYRQTS